MHVRTQLPNLTFNFNMLLFGCLKVIQLSYDIISLQMKEIMALPGRFGAWASQCSRGSACQ